MPVLFVRESIANFLPRLDLNHHPPNLYLLSSWNYRWAPPPTASKQKGLKTQTKYLQANEAEMNSHLNYFPLKTLKKVQERN
jgi:hypothetical protein